MPFRMAAIHLHGWKNGCRASPPSIIAAFGTDIIWEKLGEWSDSYGSKASQRKIYVAKGVKYFDEAGIAEFKCKRESHDLNVGDKVAVTGPTTGYVEAFVSENQKGVGQ